MRSVIAAAGAVLALYATNSAWAENRLFVIANNPDGYGIDRCLAAGDHCGSAAANAFCRSREFTQAMSFGRVDRDDITGAIPASDVDTCTGLTCPAFVAIQCTR